MYRIWMMYDHRQVLIGLHTFLFGLAFVIHFTLLSTDRYNWLDNPPDGSVSAPAAQNSALPQ